MATFVDGMIRASKLDPSLYEEVEADPDSLTQALAVVLLSSLAAGIGGLPQGGLSGLAGGIASSLVGWFLWSYLTFFIGTKVLPEAETEATYGQLLRAIGFSSAPGLVQILGVVQGIRGLVFLAASVWMLAAMVVAVRQALDYRSTARAVGVCLIGWIVQGLVLAFMLMTMGGVPKAPQP